MLPADEPIGHAVAKGASSFDLTDGDGVRGAIASNVLSASLSGSRASSYSVMTSDEEPRVAAITVQVMYTSPAALIKYQQYKKMPGIQCVKSIAAALGQDATQAPQPMQAADSKAVSAVS